MKTKLPKINYSFVALIGLGMVMSVIIGSIFYRLQIIKSYKTIYLCQQILSGNSSVYSLPHFSTLFFMTLIVVIGLIGIAATFIQILKSHRLIRAFNKKSIPCPPRFETLLKKLGIRNVLLVDERKPLSLCYGYFSPGILVSNSLIKLLDDEELESVLLHEQSHVDRKDNLKVLFGNSMRSMFFFIPLIHRMYAGVLKTNELLADSFAVHKQETTKHLKSSLKKLLAAPYHVHYDSFSQVSNPAFLESRIYHLLDRTVSRPPIPLYSTVASVSIIAFCLLLSFAPVNAYRATITETGYVVCPAQGSCKAACSVATLSSAKKIYQSIPTPTPIKCDHETKS